MNSKSVFKEYKSVYEAEADALKQLVPDLTPLLGRDTEAATTLGWYADDMFVAPDCVAPFPTDRLAAKLFDDVSKIKVSAEQAMDAFEYIKAAKAAKLVHGALSGTAVKGYFGADRQSNCQDAEYYYAKLLDQHKPGEGTFHRKISVYHHNRLPIALRKQVSASTALLLQPVMWEGHVMPAGTIVSVGNAANENLTGAEVRGEVSYQAYQIDNQGGLPMLPLRLSPWVYRYPVTRAAFALTNCDPGFANIFQNNSRIENVTGSRLKDFRKLAKKIVKLSN